MGKPVEEPEAIEEKIENTKVAQVAEATKDLEKGSPEDDEVAVPVPRPPGSPSASCPTLKLWIEPSACMMFMGYAILRLQLCNSPAKTCIRQVVCLFFLVLVILVNLTWAGFVAEITPIKVERVDPRDQADSITHIHVNR